MANNRCVWLQIVHFQGRMKFLFEFSFVLGCARTLAMCIHNARATGTACLLLCFDSSMSPYCYTLCQFSLCPRPLPPGPCRFCSFPLLFCLCFRYLAQVLCAGKATSEYSSADTKKFKGRLLFDDVSQVHLCIRVAGTI